MARRIIVIVAALVLLLSLRAQALSLFSVAAFAAPQSDKSQKYGPHTILSASEAEQIAFTRAYLENGMMGEQGEAEALTTLVLSRSSLVLPIIERKIEQVLKAADPRECFVNKDVDPQKVVGFMASEIHYAGDEQALMEASKLLKLDEKRFDRLVFGIMARSINRGNPFVLAYRGLDMGDPAVARRIVEWAEPLLAETIFDAEDSMRRRWAAALAERYGSAPVLGEWDSDPIASRLKPTLAESLHPTMVRFAFEAAQKRTPK
jgi:hypothetical protein